MVGAITKSEKMESIFPGLVVIAILASLGFMGVLAAGQYGFLHFLNIEFLR